MAATSARIGRRRLRAGHRRGIGQGSALLLRLVALFGSVLGENTTHAVDLPADKVEAMVHDYRGGGVTADGPALLIRKSVADQVSLAGTLYVDAVSNASIDVVTTASPYRETRTEYGLSADYVYRDAKLTLAGTTSREPDYTANGLSFDVSQETFGGMTTVSLGFTRGSDDVRKKGAPEFADHATHWQYRLGATQILTPRWIMSANVEALADDGYLGSPYRAARVFGAAVPERNPRTRSARALKFRVIGDLGSRDAVHAEYRHFHDTWGITAGTAEAGYSRYLGESFLADAYLRLHRQQHALFYSDNAQSETTYVSRNRQLGSFSDTGLGARLAYSARKVPGQYEVKLNGALEYTSFRFSDFTDLRNGKLYAYGAGVLQLYVSADF